MMTVAWVMGRWPVLRRHGVVPLPAAPTAVVWALAVVVSTPWMRGFGWFSAGALIHHVVPGLLARYDLATAWRAPDWALPIGMGAAVLLYGTAAAVLRPRARLSRDAQDSPVTGGSGG